MLEREECLKCPSRPGFHLKHETPFQIATCHACLSAITSHLGMMAMFDSVKCGYPLPCPDELCTCPGGWGLAWVYCGTLLTPRFKGHLRHEFPISFLLPTLLTFLIVTVCFIVVLVIAIRSHCTHRYSIRITEAERLPSQLKYL